MRQSGIGAGVVIVLCLLMGCSDDSPGALVTFRQLCQPVNDGKRLAVSGYFDVNGDVVLGRGDLAIGLSERPGGDGETTSMYLRSGLGNNSVKFPAGSSFTPDEVRIVTNDGSSVGRKDRIRVSGTVEVNKNFKPINGRYACWLNAPRIDRL